jgi:hypothetical protein
MATKFLALAAAGVLLAGTAFAQTSQPPSQQPNAKGGQMEEQNTQSSSGSKSMNSKSGSTTGMKNSNGTAGSSGTTGMKNSGASPDAKKGGAPNKATEQGNR